MKILIINGPNLNLLGKRETGIYGNGTFESYLEPLKSRYSGSDIQLDYLQSNIEGEIVTFLHEAEGNYEGVLLNAGGYTHTSVAIGDAVRAVSVPVVEVHISNIFAREDYRHISMIGAYCKGSVSGFGLDSYRLALESFL